MATEIKTNKPDFIKLPDIEDQGNTQKIDLGKGKLYAIKDIEAIKLHLKQWGYDHPKEYKAFIKAEYQRVYNLKLISKKKSKIISAFMFAVIGYGIYEALILFVNLPLPSFLR